MGFIGDDKTAAPGIAFASRTVLRAGVALLGARISTDIIFLLGGWTILLIIFAVGATILFATLIAPYLKQGPRFAILTGGAVAVCGCLLYTSRCV